MERPNPIYYWTHKEWQQEEPISTREHRARTHDESLKDSITAAGDHLGDLGLPELTNRLMLALKPDNQRLLLLD